MKSVYFLLIFSIFITPLLAVTVDDLIKYQKDSIKKQGGPAFEIKFGNCAPVSAGSKLMLCNLLVLPKNDYAASLSQLLITSPKTIADGKIKILDRNVTSSDIKQFSCSGTDKFLFSTEKFIYSDLENWEMHSTVCGGIKKKYYSRENVIAENILEVSR